MNRTYLSLLSQATLLAVKNAYSPNTVVIKLFGKAEPSKYMTVGVRDSRKVKALCYECAIAGACVSDV